MPTDPEADGALVLSYLALRKSIGTIGILLPFVLAIGKILLQSPGILSSISSYYYSDMGNVFVGSLCATGVFLWSYKGYGREDNIAGNLAAFFVIGVALLPTTPDTGATAEQTLLGNAHLTLAACFFLTLSYFALVLFRRTDPSGQPTRMKLVRNKVYIACGSTILLCIALIASTHISPVDASILALSPTFWLESIATLAFGISWFVKGEAILGDE